MSALRQNGYSVPWVEEPSLEAHKQVPEVPLDLLVVDLTKFPQQGKEMVASLASDGILNGVPVVLVSQDGAGPEDLEGSVDSVIVTSPQQMISAVESTLGQSR